MDYKFEIGQKLIVELLSKELFEGLFISGSKNRVDLQNVRDLETENELGVLSFYRNEISNINILGESTLPESTSTSTTSDKIITLSECEYERLKSMTQNFIYIPMIDKRYEDAMKYLKECESIGVAAVSEAPGRATNIELLIISSWDQIYIFDIRMYRNDCFKKDLRALFETTYVRKILFDARSLCDCLYHLYKIKINNLFDIKVADQFIQTMNDTDVIERNLGECLTHYFNFPNILEKALTLDSNMWTKRPLSDGKKMLAAQLAVYLITLRSHLDGILFKDFYDSVESYAYSTTKLSPLESQKVLNGTLISNSQGRFH